MAELDDKIELAEKRVKQLKAMKQQLEARKRALELKRLRAEDTRRKITGGALLLKMMEEDDTTKAKILKRLDGFLTRPADRALWGLDARKETETPANQAPAKSTEPDYREDAA